MMQYDHRGYEHIRNYRKNPKQTAHVAKQSVDWVNLFLFVTLFIVIFLFVVTK